MATQPPNTLPPGTPPPTPDPTDPAFTQAQTQVQSEIDAQTQPLQGQIDALSTQRDRTVGAVGATFENLQPTVNQSAADVQTSYDNAQTAQSNIFAAANARMNALKQSRAQDAQRLAQEIGGPVAVSEFTSGWDPAIASLVNLGAGEQLHTLGYAQAGEQQAQAFAGQVFPVLRTEEEAKARNYFEDQIKTIRGRIDDLNGQKSTLVDSRYNDLHQQQLQHDLQTAQLNLDRVKANRDWQATLRTLKNDEARITLSKKQFGLDTKKTAADIKLATAAEKRQAAALGLSTQQFKANQAHLAASQKLNNKKLAAAQKVTWAEYLDAAVNPQPGKTVTVTRAVPVSAAQALRGGSDAYKDPSSPTGYSKLQKIEQTATTAPITQPGDLVDYLIAHGVPKNIAVNMVKTRLRMPNWVYGEGSGPTKRNVKSVH